MCIALNARFSTHDIDAIFIPTYDVRQAAKEVGIEYGLEEGWFNDAVKGFVSSKNELVLFEQLSNLTIYVVSPRYMFADWVIKDEYFLEHPYFSLNAKGNLRLVLLAESPSEFRMRNIFTSENTLDRV